MSEHKVTVTWKRESPDFTYQNYNRDHDWAFDAGITVRASAAPAYLGSENCVDPEEAFVASLSSCHMLTFLAIASKK
jgi:organic hydroperoxide reductase OsmC/OhrA